MVDNITQSSLPALGSICEEHLMFWCLWEGKKRDFFADSSKKASNNTWCCCTKLSVGKGKEGKIGLAANRRTQVNAANANHIIHKTFQTQFWLEKSSKVGENIGYILMNPSYYINHSRTFAPKKKKLNFRILTLSSVDWRLFIDHQSNV